MRCSGAAMDPSTPDEHGDADSFSDIDSIAEHAGALLHDARPRALFEHGVAPTRIGRYAVLRRVGEGGMGVVYAAYDEDLDRRIAIKLVRGVYTRGPEAAARLRREAQALAKLSHPNVIAVHEVGEHLEEGMAPLVFVAMEFVRGQTLRDWMHQPHTPREALDVLVQAGRGLAAVHEVGVVHRDVKPENVMLGEDGRVRLMDFGLARGDAARVDPSLLASHTSGSSLPTVTRSDAVSGTPAYMAPEQFDGVVGPRADQFAFCVMAWEVLFGERPFPGESAPELMSALAAGTRREPPPRRGVGSHVRRVLDRGLAIDANDRWPDMPTLLAALSRDPRRLWRTGAVIALLASTTTLAIVRGQGGIDCRDRDERLGVWDDAARERVRASVIGTGLSYAEDTWTRVETGLDRYADAWMDVQIAACEGTEAQLSDELRTAQARCLAQRKQAFAALTDVLAEADATVVEKAVGAVAALPRLEPCTDVDWLAARVAPPSDPEVVAKVGELRDRLSRARALDDAGAYAAGFEIAEEVVAEARELDYRPILAEALVHAGRLADGLGRYAESETLLREGHALAVESGDDEIAAEASIRLVYVVGYRLARLDDGLEWRYFAEPELKRAGADPGREATLEHNVGSVHEKRGEYDASLTHVQRALAIREAAFGPDDIGIPRTLDAVAAAHRYLGDLDAALAAYERSLAIRLSVFGPAHPGVGASLSGIGDVAFLRGDIDTAIAKYREALAIVEAAWGPDHPRVNSMLGNLGAFHQRRGDLDEAMAIQQRVLASELETLGEDHPDIARTLENVGNVHYARAEYGEALQFHHRALAIREKTVGKDHPDIALSLSNIANVHYDLDEFEQALAARQRVLAIREKVLKPGHPKIADTLHAMGKTYMGMKRYDDARATFEKALAIQERELGPDHRDTGEMLRSRGDAFDRLGEHDRALADHERALAILEKAFGPDHPRTAGALYDVAETRLRRGEAELAVPLAERALAILEARSTRPLDLADTQWLVAQALVLAGGDLERAFALADRAQAAYRERADAMHIVHEIDAWKRDPKAAKFD